MPGPPTLAKVRVCSETYCDTDMVKVPLQGRAVHGLGLRPDKADEIQPVPLPETSTMPFASGPEVMAVRVSVVPLMEPVTTARPSAMMVLPAATGAVALPPEMGMPIASEPEVNEPTVRIVLDAAMVVAVPADPAGMTAAAAAPALIVPLAKFWGKLTEYGPALPVL